MLQRKASGLRSFYVSKRPRPPQARSHAVAKGVLRNRQVQDGIVEKPVRELGIIEGQ